MLTAFWILNLMYIGLIVIYILNGPRRIRVDPWPEIQTLPEKLTLVSSCRTDSDCPSNHLCMSNQCIPKLLRGGECDPDTGKWISYVYQGATIAICVCLYPEVFTQKYFGGNCDVNVGCGTYGRYVLQTNSCDCDPGYEPVGLTCRKLPVMAYGMEVCGSDEIEVSKIKPEHGFHPDYVKRIESVKCVKRPCSFDALSGRPSKHGKFVPDWGCVCDPKYGLFGVNLEGMDKKYLTTPGFDACASVLLEDPEQPLSVFHYTYFYLGNRQPFSFIMYRLLSTSEVIPILLNKLNSFTYGLQDRIKISQSWQYDYAQYLFKFKTEKIRARVKRFDITDKHGIWTSFYSVRVKEVQYENNYNPPHCDKIPNLWSNELDVRENAEKLLYSNPVCYVSDTRADPIFQDRVISNPQHLTFKEELDLKRFNAFYLKYNTDEGKEGWELDMDYPFSAEAYISLQTNVPHYPIP